MSGNHGTASKDIGKQILLKLIETHAYYSVIWFKMRTSLNVAAYGHNVWNLIYHSVVFSWYLQSYSCHIRTFGKNCHNDFERQKNSFESEHFVKKKDLQSFLLVYPRCFWHVYLKLIRHLKNNKCFQNSLSVNIVYLAGIFTIIQKQEVSMNSVDLRWTWMQLTYNDQNKFKLEWRREKKITARTMFFNWKSKRTFLSERTDNYDINCLIGFCQRERLWVCV